MSFELISDINECAKGTDNCDENAFCKNTVGSFKCRCKRGYRGNGRWCKGKQQGMKRLTK